VRIEWPRELTEEAVELLLAHCDGGCRAGRSISERVLAISRDRNDLAGIDCLPALGRTLGLEYLERTIQHIKYLRIGAARVIFERRLHPPVYDGVIRPSLGSHRAERWCRHARQSIAEPANSEFNSFGTKASWRDAATR
jgi:hypothetical protein